MSVASFDCRVYEIIVEKHPDPEVVSLELARIGGYLCVVPKDKYKNGDKVVYIPEQAVVPENILEEMNLKGRLAGSKGNRVKAIKLRGVISQGLIYPAKDEWKVGDDVKEELNITKYEPPIPDELKGEVSSWDVRIKFDVENIKKYDDIIQDGEEVIFTEKIHGTCTIITYIPDALSDLRKDDMVDGKWVVSSKGLAHQQLYYQDIEQNKDNIYLKALTDSMKSVLEEEFKDSQKLVTFYGETFGRIQDLKYGMKKDVSFRMFGLSVDGDFYDFDDMEELSQRLDIPMVPILYKGPFSQTVLEKYISGKESVSGKSLHIREGLVIYPAKERVDERIGRVFLKAVSPKYIFRKNGTEYN